jgi:seryl-tRNA synthetase
MLDITLIRSDADKVRQALLKRMKDISFEQLLSWDKEYRANRTELEKLQAKRNKVSADIPRIKKEGQDVTELLSEMKSVSSQIKNLELKDDELGKKINDFLAELPNIPADDVVGGGKENNAVVRTYGTQPVFSFTPQDHIELATNLGLIDYERGAKLGGAGFWLYTNWGARLEWALLNYFIEEHIKDGYEFTLPPHLLNWQCGYTAGQFPKFQDDVFHLNDPSSQEAAQRRLFLLPTAETALANLYRDEILKEDDLPRKFFGYTPCYRREAGSYRTSERGMIRGHQFNKVEMFIYCTPDKSELMLEELIGKAERLVQGLELHYQVSELAAEDCSAAMAKTLDIEVWIPSMGLYKEVSSASNGHDYQARRGNIRYKENATGKNLFVHTLNASGLATSRLLPAILEQHQQSDGSVKIPVVLQKWVGIERLCK